MSAPRILITDPPLIHAFSPITESRTIMDQYLTSVWSASADLETLQIQTDQAHEALVQALCVAMAAQIPPQQVATAANMSLSELFHTLRKRTPALSPEDSYAVHNP